jgi:hypothetical protein
MKKPYEEPEFIIEFFSDTDVIVCSWGGTGGDIGDDPIIVITDPDD